VPQGQNYIFVGMQLKDVAIPLIFSKPMDSQRHCHVL